VDTPANHPQSPFSKEPNGCGVETVFFHPYARSQRFDCVTILNRYSGLQDDRPAVRSLIGEVDRTP
jgi:hypothetical protein